MHYITKQTSSFDTNRFLVSEANTDSEVPPVRPL